MYAMEQEIREDGLCTDHKKGNCETDQLKDCIRGMTKGPMEIYGYGP